MVDCLLVSWLTLDPYLDVKWTTHYNGNNSAKTGF